MILPAGKVFLQMSRPCTCTGIFKPINVTQLILQIEDSVLEALARISTLRSITIGYSHRCTVQGVVALTQLRQLEKLLLMGHSAVDFGQLTSQDIQKLQILSCLSSLSIGVVAAEAFQVKRV